jgi:hypothetical protein
LIKIPAVWQGFFIRVRAADDVMIFFFVLKAKCFFLDGIGL